MVQKGSFLKRFFIALAVIISTLIFTIWITGYTYIYKTLIYTYPGIDDINIFDTRIVKDSVPQPWPVSGEYNLIKLNAELQSELIRNETVAFLVIKNDSILFESYYDNYTPGSISNSFSVSKSIVGVLTGIAVKNNLFSLDDDVEKYIPEIKSEPYSKLKISHVLSMSSGLNWNESYSSLFSPTTEAYYGTALENMILDLKVIEEPGKVFRYMSCNTVILSMIIAKTSGLTISEYASRYLWSQIGATQPAYWSLDNINGLEKSYCCFYTTAREFARIGKLYLDNGYYNGSSIVTPEYINESLQPINCKDESGNLVDYYGYHWWLMNHAGNKIFYARGILGQYIIIVPEEKIIIVRLGRLRGAKSNNNHYSDMIIYTDGVLKLFGNHP